MKKRESKRPKEPTGPKSRAVVTPPVVNLPAEEYQRTPAEQARVDQYLASKGELKAPRITLKGEHGSFEIGNDHPDQGIGQLLLMDVLATTSFNFMDTIVGQLVSIGSLGPDADERSINNALSLVKAVQPRDEIETMLATQMAAVHMATMNAARLLKASTTIPQQDANEKVFNKLARTFTAQVEALKRLRSKGEQRVYVERVNVESGGQAIVGPVNQKGEG